MTIQEAANNILCEQGKPLSSRELARIAIERGMVTSGARDPVQSHAQTIEKNIRDGIYNKPKLVFIHGPQGRLVGLPEWESDPRKSLIGTSAKLIELKARIPIELFEKIRLAEQAKLKKNFDETVAMLLSNGVSSVAPDIKKGVMQQLESLRNLQ